MVVVICKARGVCTAGREVLSLGMVDAVRGREMGRGLGAGHGAYLCEKHLPARRGRSENYALAFKLIEGGEEREWWLKSLACGSWWCPSFSSSKRSMWSSDDEVEVNLSWLCFH